MLSGNDKGLDSGEVQGRNAMKNLWQTDAIQISAGKW